MQILKDQFINYYAEDGLGQDEIEVRTKLIHNHFNFKPKTLFLEEVIYFRTILTSGIWREYERTVV